MLQRLDLIREREGNRAVPANPLKSNQHSFRGWISVTQTVFQTSAATAKPQTVDIQRDLWLLTE
jgi:hypothetical protein